MNTISSSDNHYGDSDVIPARLSILQLNQNTNFTVRSSTTSTTARNISSTH